jgi:hypothetical protein
MPTRKALPSVPVGPLYTHKPRPHEVHNVNHVHKEQQEAGGFNQRIAVILTTYVGTMFTAYGFAALAIVGLFGVLAILSPSVYTLVAWLSQTFIQLVLLPVIMVGQNVLNKHAELQAEEQFKAVINTQHDAEQIAIHLSKQDDLILQILRSLTTPPPTTTSAHHPDLTPLVIQASPPPATNNSRPRAKKGTPIHVQTDPA